ncbi:hypothetical protein OG195_04305 [Streptomyces sp. NBC_01362]|uniref:hypothetical protein n=1 Tax=Streptomyces sp. NBC_01362 TaxID=2903839 RepID=UPI002E375D62|nr:hypothetical protein [Streptomyces sp. NBC_01362]
MTDASQIHHPAQWLPASGAGIVVIEPRVDALGTGHLPAPVTHGPTHIMLDAERAALATLRDNSSTRAQPPSCAAARHSSHTLNHTNASPHQPNRREHK